jgi:aminoglycoside phosphotransferase family enzyme/predicted kinase
MNTHHQQAIFEAMKRPEFYPHPAAAIESRETHISRVFLTGSVVYKIKKPVNLEFLDFTSLEKRRHFCRREIILNRRLTENLYLSVEKIHWDGVRYSLTGPGPVVEYAVKMRQLSDTQSMAFKLAANELTSSETAQLALHLSNFYLNAKTGGHINAVGSWQTVWRNCEENFRQIIGVPGGIFDSEIVDIVRSVTRSFLKRKRRLFDHRVQEGKIRDCHGDLRTDHSYYSDVLQIIDCIEFNQRFRYTDIASDIAFLAMDLDSLGREDVSQALLEAIVRHTADTDLYGLIDFYKCYRAVVRAKITAFRLKELPPDDLERMALLKQLRRFMDLAYRYARRFTRPALWIVRGLPGSGKSTVAAGLAAALDMTRISSDLVRKELFGLKDGTSRVVSYGTDIYSPEASALTYGRLLLKAQEEIRRGRSVILDATFSSAHWRQEAARLAEDADANLQIVECIAPEKILRKRLAERTAGNSISDAREKHLEQIKAAYEPVNRQEVTSFLRVRTDQPLAESLRWILSRRSAPI